MELNRPPSDTATAILDAAEAMMRGGGYHAASFRDIAAAVAIKSASVHYHFPTKEDLGAAVLRRYLDRTLATLGDPLDPTQSPQALLEAYVALFRHALGESGKNCLCGVMMMEAQGLPDKVSETARDFLQAHTDWLAAVFRRARPHTTEDELTGQAWLVHASLQGALAASLLVAPSILDRVITQLQTFVR